MKKKILISELRKFGIFTGLFLPFLIGWLLPLIFGHDFRLWTLIVGIVFVSFGIFSPKYLKTSYEILMGFASIMSRINSKLIFGIIFYIFMMPIAIIMKLVGYDPLKRKKDNSSSYREVRSDAIVDLEKIF